MTNGSAESTLREWIWEARQSLAETRGIDVVGADVLLWTGLRSLFRDDESEAFSGMDLSVPRSAIGDPEVVARALLSMKPFPGIVGEPSVDPLPAEFAARLLTSADGRVPRCIDVSCGGGLLLCHLVSAVYSEAASDDDGDELLGALLERLHGCDARAGAVSVTRARLTTLATLLFDADVDPDAWKLEHADVLDAEGPHAQQGLFEDVDTRRHPVDRWMSNEDFDVVLCAVPERPLSPGGRDALRGRFEAARGRFSTAIPIAEQSLALAGDRGRVALLMRSAIFRRQRGKRLGDMLRAAGLRVIVEDDRHDGLLLLTDPDVRHHPGRPVTVLRTSEETQVDSLLAAMEDDDENDSVEIRHVVDLSTLRSERIEAFLEEMTTGRVLGDLLPFEPGRTTACGYDDIWRVRARDVEGDLWRPLVKGRHVSNWRVDGGIPVWWPYVEPGEPMEELPPPIERALWPFRPLLAQRLFFGESPEERELAWYEHLEHYPFRMGGDLGITFAANATQNQFALARGRMLFGQSAPVIRLRPSATEDDYFWVLGLLNSSVGCFWMKQTFFVEERTTSRSAFEISTRGLVRFPIPSSNRDEIVRLARRLHETAARRPQPEDVVARAEEGRLSQSWREMIEEDERLCVELRSAQDELDELVIDAFGLKSDAADILDDDDYRRRWREPDWDAEFRGVCRTMLVDVIEEAFATGVFDPAEPLSSSEVRSHLEGDRRASELVETGLDVPVEGFDVAGFLLSESVPLNPRRRFSADGLRRREAWEEARSGGPERGEGERVPALEPYDVDDFRDAWTRVPRQAPGRTRSRLYRQIGRWGAGTPPFLHLAELSEATAEAYFGWARASLRDRVSLLRHAWRVAKKRSFKPPGTPSVTDPRACGFVLGLESLRGEVRRWAGMELEEQLDQAIEDVTGGGEMTPDVFEAYTEKVLNAGREAFEPDDSAVEAGQVDLERLVRLRELLWGNGDGLAVRELAERLSGSEWSYRDVGLAVRALEQAGSVERDDDRVRLVPQDPGGVS